MTFLGDAWEMRLKISVNKNVFDVDEIRRHRAAMNIHIGLSHLVHCAVGWFFRTRFSHINSCVWASSGDLWKIDKAAKKRVQSHEPNECVSVQVNDKYLAWVNEPHEQKNTPLFDLSAQSRTLTRIHYLDCICMPFFRQSAVQFNKIIISSSGTAQWKHFPAA